MSKLNAPESAGNIVKFRVSSNFTEYAVELAAGVVDFRYYENVLSNNVTATATIVETGYSDGTGDSQSTVDGLPIRGGERTDITIEDVYGNELTLEEGLYVNRIRDVNPDTTKDVYFLDFASREFFANEQTRVVKKYEGNIGDNVEKILKDVLKVTTDIEIDNTAIPKPSDFVVISDIEELSNSSTTEGYQYNVIVRATDSSGYVSDQNVHVSVENIIEENQSISNNVINSNLS